MSADGRQEKSKRHFKTAKVKIGDVQNLDLGAVYEDMQIKQKIDSQLESVEEIKNCRKRKLRNENIEAADADERGNGSSYISNEIVKHKKKKLGRCVLVENVGETSNVRRKKDKKLHRKNNEELDKNLPKHSKEEHRDMQVRQEIDSQPESTAEISKDMKRKKKKKSRNENIDAANGDELENDSSYFSNEIVKRKKKKLGRYDLADNVTESNNTRKEKKKKKLLSQTNDALNANGSNHSMELYEDMQLKQEIHSQPEKVKEINIDSEKKKKKKKKKLRNENIEAADGDERENDSSNISNEIVKHKKKKLGRYVLVENVEETSNVRRKNKKKLHNKNNEELDENLPKHSKEEHRDMQARQEIDSQPESVAEISKGRKKKKKKKLRNENIEAADEYERENDSNEFVKLKKKKLGRYVLADNDMEFNNTRKEKKKKKLHSQTNDALNVNGSNHSMELYEDMQLKQEMPSQPESVKEIIKDRKRKKKSRNENIEAAGINERENDSFEIKDDLAEHKTKKRRRNVVAENDEETSGSSFHLLETEQDDESSERLTGIHKDKELKPKRESKSTEDGQRKKLSKSKLKSTNNSSFLETLNDLDVDRADHQDLREEIPQKAFEVLNHMCVVLPFDPPYQHTLEKNITRGPPVKYYAKVKEVGVEIKKGVFTQTEDNIIRQNWEQFAKEYKLSSEYTTYLAKQTAMRQKAPMCFAERKKFVQWLARGLENRWLSSVFRRFQIMYLKRKVGRYSSHEDDIIRHLPPRIDMPYLTMLGRRLNRSKMSIYYHMKRLSRLDLVEDIKKYKFKRHIVAKDGTFIDKNIELMTKFLNTILKVKKIKLAELQHDEITSKNWEDIEKELNVPRTTLEPIWTLHLYMGIFGYSSDSGDIRHDLIETLIERDEQHFRGINWCEISKLFGGVPNRYLRNTVVLMLKRIPKKNSDDLRAALRFLREHLQPKSDFNATIQKYVYKYGKLRKKDRV